MNNNHLLAIILVGDEATCFVKLDSVSWRQESVFRETWYSVSNGGLRKVLDELNARLNRSDKLADFVLHLVYSQQSLPCLQGLPGYLADLNCSRWQLLQWEPMRDRAALLAGNLPSEPQPSIDWLRQYLLPVLEATFHFQDDALAAERARAEREHEESLESLRADRLRLEAEIVAQREQLSALHRPAIEDLLAFLPALYRNPFGTISPHDLALLAGGLQVPPIQSPWPEPEPNTLKALQARLRKLPEKQAGLLRDFCRQLPHKLELRAEMRTWLGDD